MERMSQKEMWDLKKENKKRNSYGLSNCQQIGVVSVRENWEYLLRTYNERISDPGDEE